MQPGRTCPLSYAYRPEAVLGEARLRADTLWIAGGLYGNPYALESLLEAFDAEPGEKALVFNGDFHWFDASPEDFARVNDAVLARHATRGNVETELAEPQEGAGCGCGYPDWVDEGTVERSNAILERVRAAQPAAVLSSLKSLPMHLGAEVGDARVAIVHGDLESLAGWGFSQEALATPAGAARADACIARAGADIVASSHTCLPVLQSLSGRIIANNGAAGMPNFRGDPCGLATRISLSPSRNPLYGIRHEELFVEAVPLRYDHAAWRRRFLATWPPGSPAHDSYWSRIADGPRYALREALRPAVALRAARG